jgi:toxin ParE1/3/4
VLFIAGKRLRTLSPEKSPCNGLCLFIQTEAILEIRDAFDWYEQQKEGLGYELIEEIEACYKAIIENPGHYSFINHLFRRIKTNRFPYIIVYEFEGDTIIVNSVRHIKREPQ